MKFTKNGKIGYLEIVPIEKQGKNGYYWSQGLALVNDKGGWWLSLYWRSNAFKMAEKDLLGFGWIKTVV